MPLKLMYITNNPDVALAAERYGVDRIFVDLETLGKEERQKDMNTVKSKHTIRDIKVISSLLTTSEMLVRINPWNTNSIKEIDDVILAGGDIIMLPMWKTVEEVKEFINAVNKRAKVILLLETKEAAEIIDDIMMIEGIDEIYIGLNDLHLSYGMKFMFEPLSNGIVENLCKKIKAKNIPYGFGGIARLGEGLLPAEKVIMEHYRLGSTIVILSRSFCNTNQNANYEELFMREICRLRNYEDGLGSMDAKEFNENQLLVCSIVENIVNEKG